MQYGHVGVAAAGGGGGGIADAGCESGVPHDPQNLACGVTAAPHEEQNSEVGLIVCVGDEEGDAWFGLDAGAVWLTRVAAIAELMA